MFKRTKPQNLKPHFFIYAVLEIMLRVYHFMYIAKPK